MAIKRLQATVAKLHWYTPDLCYVEFALPEAVEFQAGQFMNLSVVGGARRSYSLANSPVNNLIAATYADTVAGGPGSQFFLQLQEGQVVDVMLPFGSFVYQPGDSPVYFFATGTGIVPFMSMLDYELSVLRSGREVHLIYGVRHEERIMVGEELARLAEMHPNFHVEIFVSQPRGDWTGRIGRVNAIIPELEISASAQIYLCGSGDMIQDLSTSLQAHGVDPVQILHEKFY